MPHFKLTLSYDGTRFVGWQRQAAGSSIQGLLEDALGELDGSPVAVIGAGRTDAGVHALGQVASASLSRIVDAATVIRAVNARLPPAIRVLDATEVHPEFHARYHVTSKTYRYRIWNGRVLSPFERDYVWHVPWPALNVDAMSAAARLIEGRHDFAAFQSSGAETRTTERVVFSSCIVSGPPRRPDGSPEAATDEFPGAAPLIVYEIRGEGFLRHMVRSLAGSLVEVGRGRHPATWMREVLISTSRAHAGPTAPASGLFLVRVEYEEPGLTARGESVASHRDG